MPSKSKKQHNLMEMVAHDPKKAKQLGIPQSVGKEFVAADKGRKFGTGGDVGYTYGGQNQIGKQRTRFGSTFGYKNNIPNANINRYIGKKEGGKIMATESKKEMREEMKLDTAQDKKMIKKAVSMHDKQLHDGKKTNLSKLKGGGMARMTSKGEHTVQKQSKRGAEVVKMARGGGIESKGKTKGKFITMCMGGKARAK